MRPHKFSGNFSGHRVVVAARTSSRFRHTSSVKLFKPLSPFVGSSFFLFFLFSFFLFDAVDMIDTATDRG